MPVWLILLLFRIDPLFLPLYWFESLDVPSPNPSSIFLTPFLIGPPSFPRPTPSVGCKLRCSLIYLCVRVLPYGSRRRSISEAESKSFMIGYRSAWFRCKIKSMTFRKRQIGYFLEFFDYPDEKIRWTKLYQNSLQQPDQALEEGKLELMVRPPFPPFFRKSQLPKFCPTSDVIAITNDTWKVGDLVDWWYDSCYWSGRVSELLKDDHIKINLPKPPVGEGNSYIAHCKDLRPSLDWTPENGWMLPVRKEHGNFDSCAILIHRNSYGAFITYEWMVLNMLIVSEIH
ncbi:hypothetical protein C4D60_Mb05t18890 [Musa balbisiana]|uniref:Agenet domain-containing protein n=1 Tax=Musa balbisiana TaxID=52838 RepID=A0A4S8JX56_MUSBA|nr:hypothetical protein C4D60_Mb05t18890 [Musa balbisiana]